MASLPAPAHPGLLPFFLDTPGGRLFAVHHTPPAGVSVRGQVLCALPFNEEMNRCRSMVSQQATALALQGYGTLVLDYCGTGDSAGDYRDARWDIWLDNLRSGLAWLKEQPGGCRLLWGIRLGALLAAEILATDAPPGVALAVWQPVTDGKLHLTQFLRVRIAAALDRPDLPKETTAGMRERFAAGEGVEIAGYEIHPELARQMDRKKLASVVPAAGTPCLWLENGGEDAVLPPASQAVVDGWLAGGVAVSPRIFQGPAFWQLHERVLAPKAIDETIAWLQSVETRP